MNKFYFLLFFLCLSANMTMAQLSPGDILFTAYRFDGNLDSGANCEDGFAFTNFVDIPVNTTIYFTEEEWLGNAFGDQEGDISWSHNEVVPAGSVIQLVTHSQSTTDECNGMDGILSATIGTIQYAGNSWALSTSAEEIYAYLGSVRQPSTWLCAMFTDNLDGSNTIPDQISNFIQDFSNVNQDSDLGIFTGSCNDLASCKTAVLDPNNWTIENDGGNGDCCDADGVDYPEDIPTNIPSVITINFEDNFDGGTTATLFLDGEQNGRNRYRSDQMAGAGNLECYWSGTRWEIRDLDQNSVPYFSKFDVSPNPPNLATGCWESAFGDNLIVFSGDGAQAISLDLSFTAPTLCSGASSVTLSGGSPAGGTYSGNGVTNNGNGTFTFDPNVAGVGTTTITYGCSANNATAEITVNGALGINISSTSPLCFGSADGTATANVTSGQAPYSYLWSTGATTSTISSLTANLYSVTVTDANGCTGEASATLSNPTAVSVMISAQTNIDCNGNTNGTANANATGGTPPYTYSWSNGQNGATISDVAAGTYEVTATDANGCTNSTTVTITEPTAITVNITSSNISCNGDADGTASVSATGGTPSYTYSWSNGQNGATISGVAAGTYEVTVTDANGCTNSTTVSITEPSLITLSLNSTADNGSANGTATVVATGGTPDYTYSWNNGAATPTITDLVEGTYEVTVTDANGCESVSSIIVESAVLLPNEQCGDAASIDSLFHRPQNVPYTSPLYTNVNYTTDASDPTTGFECFLESTLHNSRWFTFTGDGSMYYITTVECNSSDYIDNGDTQMAIYSGDCSALVAEACNEDGPDAQQGGPYPAGLELQTEEGKEYSVLIDGWEGADGEFCIQVTNLSPTSIQNQLTIPFDIYPNPTTDLFHIQGLTPNTARIMDSLGRTIMNVTKDTNQMSIAHLPAGVYTIQIVLDGKSATRKIVKH